MPQTVAWTTGLPASGEAGVGYYTEGEGGAV
jgi:hypothetical protein